MSRKLWIGAGVLALGVLAAGGGAWATRDQAAYARIATGFAAKQTCSCLHVSGRQLSSCLAEFPEDARRQVNVTAEGREVRATVLFGAISAEAIYEDGFGCRLTN